MRASVSRTRARHAATYCSEEIVPSRMSRAASVADNAWRFVGSIAVAKVAGIPAVCNSALFTNMSFVRFVIVGPPPVKWTRSWTRMLWRAFTRRNPN